MFARPYTRRSKNDNEDGDGNNEDDKGYVVSESDTDSDAVDDEDSELDEKAAEAADTAAFVTKAIGTGSGQLRQVQQGLF